MQYVVEAKITSNRISPSNICWPFTPLPGHITRAQSAVVTLLAEFSPGLAAHAHSAAIWPLYLYQGMMPMCGAPSSLALFVPE